MVNIYSVTSEFIRWNGIFCNQMQTAASISQIFRNNRRSNSTVINHALY